jgi:hypothetical protein
MPGFSIGADEHFALDTPLPPQLECATGRELVIVEVGVNIESLHGSVRDA